MLLVRARYFEISRARVVILSLAHFCREYTIYYAIIYMATADIHMHASDIFQLDDYFSFQADSFH